MLMAASVTIEDLVIRRHVHDEHVTDAAAGAQPGFSRDDRAQQLVGVQAAFHQELGLALPNQFHRLCRRGMAVRHVDNASLAKMDPVGRRDLPDFCGRADQNGDDQSLARRPRRRPRAPFARRDAPRPSAPAQGCGTCASSRFVLSLFQ